MDRQTKWGDKRYHSLNCFLRDKFGEKVFKISLDGGFTCPNRDGTISRGGCIFCSARGSGDYAGQRLLPIGEQFDNVKLVMNKKWEDGKYIAYFQAYTNTYETVDVLRRKYEEALNKEGVVALAIATRPDCLNDDILDLLQEMNKKVYTWIELGLQTIHEETAEIINRGYKLEVFDDAMKKLKARGLDTVVHTIFGLPGETKEQMLDTVKHIAKSSAKGIKFHLLHLMKDTELEKFYEQGKLEFLTQHDYVELICKSICMLPPEIVVHRLTGDAPRALLVGPLWSLKKWEVLNEIDKTMEDSGYYQGLYFSTNK